MRNASFPIAPQPGPSHLVSCSAFWAWVLVGALGAIGLVSLGPIALGPAGVAATALSSSRTARRSASGLLTGAGLVSLLVAYLQRNGPGTTCWHTATGVGCADHLDPVPWLLAGIVLVLAGTVLHRRKRT